MQAAALIAAYALGLFLYGWITGYVPLVAIPAAPIDDGLFVRLALNLSNGDWLGEYDNLTLAKGIFYPVWIAAARALELPLLTSQFIVYALGCLLISRGLRPWLGSEAATLALFGILLLSPVPYGYNQLRVIREGAYVPLTLLVAAGVIWWIRWRDGPVVRRILLSLVLGLTLAAYWATREEGIGILPFLGAALAIAFGLDLRGEGAPPTEPFRLQLRRSRGRLSRTAGLAALAVVVALGATGLLMRQNELRYGVFDTVEFKQHEFVAGYSAFTRIRHEGSHARYVVVPREVLARAFAASEAAAELRPYFDSAAPNDFIAVGCAVYGLQPCDNELRAGWFMWALRNAAAEAGHYRSAPASRAYYQRLAQEIDTACHDGRLQCLPPRVAMNPPFRLSDVAESVRTAWQMLVFVATLETVALPEMPQSWDEAGCSRSADFVKSFLRTTRSPLFVVPAGLERDIHCPSAADFRPRDQARANLAVASLGPIIAAYRAVLPWALGIGAAAFLCLAITAMQRRSVEPLFLVAGLAGTLFVTRIAMLAYVDTVSIPTLNSSYPAPAFPALLVFTVAALLGGGRLLMARAQRVLRVVLPLKQA